MKIDLTLALLSSCFACGCTPSAELETEFRFINFSVESGTKAVEHELSDVIQQGFVVSSPGLMDNVAAEYSEKMFRTAVYWPSGKDKLDFFAVFPPQYGLCQTPAGDFILSLGSAGEPFGCDTDILVAACFGAEGTPVHLRFIHPLCYVSKFRCSLSDDAPAGFSVIVEEIRINGVAEYGEMTFPDSESGACTWTAGGSAIGLYCENAGLPLSDGNMQTVEGEGLMLIPSTNGRYSATVLYRICTYGYPSDIQESSFEFGLSPGKRGYVDIIFSPAADYSAALSFSLELEPWDSDDDYNHTIKLQ